MITAEMIRQIAPRARQDYVDALVSGAAEFEKWGVTTPERLAAFVATICHETGGLTIVRENMNYSSANRLAAVWPTRFGRYDPDLKRTVPNTALAAPFVGNPKALANKVYGGRMGNERDGTGDDDGWRYRGGGLIQLTGRDSYERAGKAIGVPLGEHPELIEDAKISLQAALWEFSLTLKYADKGESGFRAVCNAINRGNALSSLPPIGWDDRRSWYAKCVKCLGACQTAEDVLEVGDSGALVKAVQERLCALGYAVGKVDGVFGSRTRAAVLAFQAENALATDGRIGAQTRACLNSESAKPMPLGERAQETKEDLKAAGDKTLATTDQVKTAVKAVGTTATTFAVADQTGLLDSASGLLSDLQQYQGVASGMSAIVTWSLQHWWYFVPLVCYVGYRWATTVEGQRMLKHNLGLDLSR